MPHYLLTADAGHDLEGIQAHAVDRTDHVWSWAEFLYRSTRRARP